MSAPTITPRQAAGAARRARTTARLEDLHDLMRAGESPEHAAARVGWTPTAASKAAYRCGELDTARTLGRIAAAQRTRTAVKW